MGEVLPSTENLVPLHVAVGETLHVVLNFVGWQLAHLTLRRVSLLSGVYSCFFFFFSPEIPEVTKLIGPKASVGSLIVLVLFMLLLVHLLSSVGFVFTMAAYWKITCSF